MQGTQGMDMAFDSLHLLQWVGVQAACTPAAPIATLLDVLAIVHEAGREGAFVASLQDRPKHGARYALSERP